MITLRNVEKFYEGGYGRSYVLRRINLDVKEGEFVTIMGPSGAGKSTLLSILGMLDGAWTGEFEFVNLQVHRMKPRERAELNKKYIESDILLVQLGALPRLHPVHLVVHKLELAGPGAVEHPQDAQKRRFPRARGSHDGDKLALFDFQVDAPQHVAPAKAAFIEFLDIAKCDHDASYSCRSAVAGSSPRARREGR